MSLKRFLAEGRLWRQNTGRAEVIRLLQVAARDLLDSEVEGLSVDRRFATAYNAALLSAEVQALQPRVIAWLTDHHPELIEKA